MKVQRNRFAGLVLSLFGKRSRGLSLEEDGLTVLGKPLRHVTLVDISGASCVEKGFPFSSLTIPLMDGSSLRVAGIKPKKAAPFVTALNTAWRDAIGTQIAAHADEIDALAQAVERLELPRRYPAACLLEPFVERTRRLFAAIPVDLPREAMPPDRAQALDRIGAFHRDPVRMRDQAIARFVEAELSDMQDFFDQIESNPLTPEQRLAVATDEDATLVLAGAGSGKTSVITAKAAYLIERGIRPPEDILLMAFGKDAATEMAGRIEARCGAPVAAKTFHALAYGIIAEVEGQAPALADHASDDAQFNALIRDILRDLASRPGKALHLLIQWFAEFFRPERSPWEFKSKHEYYSYVEEQELRSLQGERVRSFEELQIANWLYLNGIAYEYEPLYEHPLPKTGRGAYTPDFRLTASGVYIEHFGVRKAPGPDGTEVLTTAPYIDRDSYLEDMAWKREVHAEHGTTLVETYSYERVEGRLTKALAEKLEPYVTLNPRPPEQVFERLTELGQVDAFTQTLGTFLRHFKGSGRTVEECREKTEGLKEKARGRAFLEIFEPVHAEYQERLGPRIDFEDMIARATAHVRAGRYKSPFRHLLVDEFQDISQGRAELLRALKAQHADARIFAVGDDWQSIYRFTGSDIRLMRNFGQEFGGTFAGKTGIHRTVDLGRTFRSVDRIALPARSFVLKNASQITKAVIPAGTAAAPAIRVAYVAPKQEAAALQQVLTDIRGTMAGTSDKKTTVLLVGRYRHLRPKNIAALEREHPGLSISFKTVHASKGLEADHVVILGAESGRFGFPSEIVDDPILDLVLPEPEKFEHAEERRVFYVALTRARKTVTLLAPGNKPSAFVRELIENPDYGAVELGEAATPVVHRCPACGGRLIPKRSERSGLRFVCEHRRHCRTSRPACPACGNDLPERSKSEPDVFVCSCGTRFPACPSCGDGWLVERKGRFGPFLGCVTYPRCKGRTRVKGNDRTSGGASEKPTRSRAKGKRGPWNRTS
ncbi:UvrD-helicase domain-containing protein [Rhodovulum marinum]|nr:UvrD-helicase domain-containing protein [Rhodovulum marinum]